MSDTILTAIISGLCVGIPSILATRASNNKCIALLEYRLEELTKQVEKHNSVVERMAIVERDLKTAFRYIEELRKE